MLGALAKIAGIARETSENKACFYPKFCYTTIMIKKDTSTAFKTDQEITFDGGRWGIVDVVIDGYIIVIDEDGGDHELTEARID